MSVLNYKVIIPALGRADLVLSRAEFESWLDKILATIKAINAEAKIVLSAIL